MSQTERIELLKKRVDLVTETAAPPKKRSLLEYEGIAVHRADDENPMSMLSANDLELKRVTELRVLVLDELELPGETSENAGGLPPTTSPPASIFSVCKGARCVRMTNQISSIVTASTCFLYGFHVSMPSSGTHSRLRLKPKVFYIV
jgi:hypothetical protein